MDIVSLFRFGVLHLIETPLVIKTQSLLEMLAADYQNNRYRNFFKILETYPDTLAQLKSAVNVTVLVPTNEAIDSVEEVTENIVNYHVIDKLVLESHLAHTYEEKVRVSKVF